ncbi:GNAT family N-acetyltransferase [Pontibacillus sp. HMF3514]|uniref:GNAT family N-acetyltransferase n=1 Tax=Pontibacillus sp. HMF3514 TaxID=2692425 RepID=UPI00131FA01B|nr:GNAT family N-acetyltransferase [Pontibacillus sp. HMF3514]QHE51945.1 GNAT family N-acetyltransferase [Pontibacillus sp. HMF3514]
MDESIRGQGYGKQLLHQLEEYAKANYYLILLDSSIIKKAPSHTRRGSSLIFINLF